MAPRYAATRWSALGSYVSLVVADPDRLGEVRAACEQVLARIDRTCSRFREDSDLMRANRSPGHWVKVDAMLVRATATAVRVAEATAGLVDPTVGEHLVRLGYDRDLADLPSDAPGPWVHQPLEAGPIVPDAWRQLGVDAAGGAIRVPQGVSLDLGATGKAFAADVIAATVPDRTGTALIISLGGDVAVGTPSGRPAVPVGPKPWTHRWQVAVAERPQDAVRPEAEIVALQEGGLATSSTLARRWRRGQASVHHLLDPRTGLPADPTWRTASVCAATCVDANAASTAAIVLGDQAPAWLWERDLAARLVAADGRVMRIAGWPASPG